METEGVSTASKKYLRRASIVLARTKTDDVKKAWLLIRQGSLSLWQKRYVIAAGHYVQVCVREREYDKFGSSTILTNEFLK
jgi:hypothetical protein